MLRSLIRALVMRSHLRPLRFPCHRHLIVVALAIFAARCGDSAVAQLTGPAALTKCQTTLSGLPASVEPVAARVTATVSTNRECQWTVVSEAPWLQVSPSSGQGETAVSVAVAENPAAINRSATLVVNGTRVAVSQNPAPCRFELSSSSARLSPEGGSFRVDVSAVAGCKWTASSEIPWVRVATSELTGSDMERALSISG